MMVVLLDDLQVILGMEFIHTTKLVSISFLNFLFLVGGDDPCVVPVSREGTKDLQQISDLQLKKVVRKSKLTSVAKSKAKDT